MPAERRHTAITAWNLLTLLQAVSSWVVRSKALSGATLPTYLILPALLRPTHPVHQIAKKFPEDLS